MLLLRAVRGITGFWVVLQQEPSYRLRFAGHKWNWWQKGYQYGCHRLEINAEVVLYLSSLLSPQSAAHIQGALTRNKSFIYVISVRFYWNTIYMLKRDFVGSVCTLALLFRSSCNDSRGLLEKLIVAYLAKNCYWIRNPLHKSPPLDPVWCTWIQFNPVSLRFFLILSTHVSYREFLFLHPCVWRAGLVFKLWNSSVRSCFLSPVISLLLPPNILSSALPVRHITAFQPFYSQWTFKLFWGLSNVIIS